MKGLLNSIEQRFKQDDGFQRLLLNYSRAIKTEDWQFFLYAIESVKMEMREDLLSKRFTELDAVEKDVQQRAYYSIKQVLDFLSNPQSWLVKKKMRMEKFKNYLTRPVGKKKSN